MGTDLSVEEQNSREEQLTEKTKTFVVPGDPGIRKIRKQRKIERKNRKASRKHNANLH